MDFRRDFCAAGNGEWISICRSDYLIVSSGDPDFVEQIPGNLINNVERYAASGRSLIVHCATTESRVTIDVIDAGPGIAAHQRANVFRPFSRISNDLRASTGTGIGLSIARDLARLHDGDVRLLESAQGCWFCADLGSLRTED